MTAVRRGWQSYILFLALAVTSAFAVAGAAWVDREAALPGVAETGIKLVFLLGLGAWVSLRADGRGRFFSRFPARYLLLALLPAVSVLLSQLCPFDQRPSLAALGGMLLGVLSTALWEELLFRALAQELFLRPDGRYAPLDVLFLAAVFALPHAINLLIHPVLWQLLLAFCAGLFFLALYRRTGSLALTVLSHFLMNAASRTIGLCASGSMRARPYLGAVLPDILSILGMAAMAAAGIAILLKNGLLSRVDEARQPVRAEEE